MNFTDRTFGRIVYRYSQILCVAITSRMFMGFFVSEPDLEIPATHAIPNRLVPKILAKEL